MATLNDTPLPAAAAPPARREQTPREEWWNCGSHALAFITLFTAGPYLVSVRAYDGTAMATLGALIFTLCALALYLSSMIYHSLPPGPSKAMANRIDHASIYLLIAGTYTPFMLTVLWGVWGKTLLVLVWMMAAVGVWLKLRRGIGNRRLSTGLYLAMGWLIVLAIKPLYDAIPREGFYWLVAGGAAYTLGVVFYSAKRLPYHHLLWHLFVMAGTACHFCAVFWYAR